MLSRVGSLNKNGRYRIICKTAVQPSVQQTCSVDDFITNTLVDECVGDILDVFVFEDCVKTINSQRKLFSVWSGDNGHVVIECK